MLSKETIRLIQRIAHILYQEKLLSCEEHLRVLDLLREARRNE